FPLRATIRVEQLEKFYDIAMRAEPGDTLDEAIRKRLGSEGLKVGATADFGPIELKVRQISADGRVEDVGMIILREQLAEAGTENLASGDTKPDTVEGSSETGGERPGESIGRTGAAGKEFGGT